MIVHPWGQRWTPFLGQWDKESSGTSVGLLNRTVEGGAGAGGAGGLGT